MEDLVIPRTVNLDALAKVMETEAKPDLMRMLTNILWAKPSREIVHLIIQELTAKELRSLANSYGIPETERTETT